MQSQPASRPVRWIAWWALAAAAATAWQGPSLLRDMRPPGDVVVDFYQEWASARNFLSGAPVYESQRESCRRYLGCAPAGETHFFLEVNAHPPTAVLLGLPLAPLDYPTAVLVWNLVSLVALGVSIWLIARQLGVRLNLRMILPAVVFVMLCWPLRSHLAQGQLVTVLLLLVSGAWAADRSDREFLAGALLGVATALKLFPALLFLHFVFRGRWRALAAGLACV
ncbi:MAG TPA: glycosyltransferase family 87 protein, partial [Gemmataceae bacterium]|nr:glycosyltransferase family 87 protein [Gemmataceae bacterium]